ncbi:MAG: carbon storage regulator [Planctomycetota bacterium]
MLVMTRRVNDRIVFPALGISIELIRVTPSRAQLGVFAPRGIRVLRHELLEKESERPTDGELEATIRRELSHHLQDAIEQATERVYSAQQKLNSGQTADALRELSVAIGELDALRVAGDDVAAPSAEPNASHADWESAGAVREAASSYTSDHPKVPPPRVILVEPEEAGEGYQSESRELLAENGIDYTIVTNSLEVFCELSRADAATTVVVSPDVGASDTAAVVDLIHEAIRQESVKVCILSEQSSPSEGLENLMMELGI